MIGPLLTDLVIRHLLDVDMCPIEDVQPCVPVFFHTQGAPGPREEGEGGEQLLTALLERVILAPGLEEVKYPLGSRKDLPGGILLIYFTRL